MFLICVGFICLTRMSGQCRSPLTKQLTGLFCSLRSIPLTLLNLCNNKKHRYAVFLLLVGHDDNILTSSSCAAPWLLTDRPRLLGAGTAGWWTRGELLLTFAKHISDFLAGASQKPSVTAHKTTHRVVLLTAFNSPHFIKFMQQQKTPLGGVFVVGGLEGN